MAAPAFVHLRLHSEFSIADGTVRIADAVAAAAADAMPALAITDLANAFGLVKFYKAARAHGIKPIFGCDVWLTHDAERDQPFRALLLAQSRAGYLKLAEWLTRAYRAQPVSRPRGDEARVVRRRHRRPDRALRRARRRRRLGAAAGQCRRRSARRRSAGRRCFPGRYYLEVQRAGPRRRRRARRRDGSSRRRSSRCRSWRRIRCSSCAARIFARTRRACASRRAIVLADPRRPRRLHPRPVFQVAGGDGRGVRRSARGAREFRRDRAALQPHDPAGQELPAGFSDAAGRHARRPSAQRSGAGLERRLEVLYPDPAARDAKRAEYAARLEFETKTIVQMGFAGYFLIVADFINWAKRNGVPVGPGPRLGRGLARRLRARHHRSRSAALRSASSSGCSTPNAISMPDLDIDFCQNGRDRVIDYVKKKYGARVGVADRDVRHDGGQGRGPRRRSRARPARISSATASRS